MSPVRILGIGSPFGDDRVGWEVVERLRTGGYLAPFPAGAIAAECCDRAGAGLVAHLAGADFAILVDAMRSGAAPARRLRRRDRAPRRRNEPGGSRHDTGSAGVHRAGIGLIHERHSRSERRWFIAIAAIDILESSPMSGRPMPLGLRELVISGVSNGYLALYRYDAITDAVYVLAIRSQRELRYRLGT